MMMDVVREVMFDNAYLDFASGHVSRVNSHAITMQGNRVMINATLIQSAGFEDGDDLILTIEGSYDGQVWLTTGLGSLTIGPTTLLPAPRNASSSAPIDDVDYSYLRLRAEVTTDGAGSQDPRVLFDADLVLSQQ